MSWEIEGKVMFNIFKRKKVFCFVGSRDLYRTLQEKAYVDKEQADMAFRRYKKEILDSFLLSKGFYLYKTNAYVRINKIGLLEYINLQKERYGSKTFCVNFLIMPLYYECRDIDYALSQRLGWFISGKDVWWDFASEYIAKCSFVNVTEAIEKYLLPWFVDNSKEDVYRAYLVDLGEKKFAKNWLDALENTENKEELIRRNAEKMKLPKKLVNNMKYMTSC